MMWDTNAGMGWWMVFAMVLWLLFWGSVIYLFFYALARVGHRGDDPRDPMDVARHRLARGDITPEQYQEISRHLRPPAGQSP